jgi:hypothetical protein
VVLMYVNVFDLDDDQRKKFLTWIEDEGLSAAHIANDGRFSVHNGRVAGTRFLLSEDEQSIVINRHNEPVKVPFNVPQKNPLPEGL